jgi:hypothetical protein
MIRLFISHSSHDTETAKRLAELIRTALHIEKQAIRCTSVDGYRLPAGANTNEQLRREVLDCEVLIGLISRKSLESAYVLFELGARWGKNEFMAPVLAPGVPASIMRGPLSAFNALSCSNSSQLYQLVHDVAAQLGITARPPSEYEDLVAALAQMNPEETSAVETPEHEPTQLANADEYSDSEEVIKQYCEARWGDDYSMRAYCENEQREAVAKLRAPRPDDVPLEVFAKIRANAASRWPREYSMRVYTENEQTEAYRKVRRQ